MLILCFICSIILFVLLLISAVLMNKYKQYYTNLTTEHTILTERFEKEVELNKKLQKELELEKQINISADKIEKKTRTKKTSKK